MDTFFISIHYGIGFSFLAWEQTSVNAASVTWCIHSSTNIGAIYTFTCRTTWKWKKIFRANKIKIYVTGSSYFRNIVSVNVSTYTDHSIWTYCRMLFKPIMGKNTNHSVVLPYMDIQWFVGGLLEKKCIVVMLHALFCGAPLMYSTTEHVVCILRHETRAVLCEDATRQ